MKLLVALIQEYYLLLAYSDSGGEQHRQGELFTIHPDQFLEFCLVAATNSLSCSILTDARRAILQRQHRIAKAIGQTMRDSPEHLGVQFTGCSALSNLARNGEHHRRTHRCLSLQVLSECTCSVAFLFDTEPQRVAWRVDTI